jgi:hypothetical protein
VPRDAPPVACCGAELLLGGVNVVPRDAPPVDCWGAELLRGGTNVVPLDAPPVAWLGEALPGGGEKGTAWAACQGVPARTERKAIAPRLLSKCCFISPYH